MQIAILESEAELAAYEAFLHAHPHDNLWQSLSRADYNNVIGREVRVYAARDERGICATAQVVIDGLKLTTWEIPRGPLWTNDEAVKRLMETILSDAKKAGALSVSYSPFVSLPIIIPGAKPSNNHIHAEATRIVDLSLSEAEILAQMHPKGRYNIKVAERDAVLVKESNDIEAFHKLLQETGARDRFGILPLSRYKAFLEHLEGSFLLLASVNSKPIAGLLGVMYQKTGIYYYGASSYEHRSLMAPYALQWAAIRMAKAKGCTKYDLLGIAPVGSAASHPWARLSDFKAKFGGSVVTYPPEQEVILRPVTKKLLEVKRKILG
jgi:lipid II:glycine glycyltransferase (peptidoglycan interpeptide bridge formation enzyme)